MNTKKSQLDVSSLASGIYLMRIINEKAVSVRKIIVE
ncbi:MAG: T9SS type A sorting domain-containing protein [Bacteroidales bacterium]|nr:T9SS type A sorting domain-containing protein [Bacteroidales bacterium]